MIMAYLCHLPSIYLLWLSWWTTRYQTVTFPASPWLHPLWRIQRSWWRSINILGGNLDWSNRIATIWCQVAGRMALYLPMETWRCEVVGSVLIEISPPRADLSWRKEETFPPISLHFCMFAICFPLELTEIKPEFTILWFLSTDFTQGALQTHSRCILRSSQWWLVNLDMEIYLGFIFYFLYNCFRPKRLFIVCICTDEENVSEIYSTVTVWRSPIKGHTVYGCVCIQYGGNPYLDQWPASALDVCIWFSSRALILFRTEVAVVSKANILC